MTYVLIKTDNYLLVVDDKDKDFYAYDYGLYKNYKLGLVTGCNDDVLEFEGECIDESNLSKIIAHLPLNGSIILEGVDLLPPYHQEDILENIVDEITSHWHGASEEMIKGWFKFGYEKAREKYKYTEEDVRKAIFETRKGMLYNKKYEDEYIQSLYQYPTEFECETEPYTVAEMSSMPLGTVNQKPKTITTAQGTQWVGRYK